MFYIITEDNLDLEIDKEINCNLSTKSSGVYQDMSGAGVGEADNDSVKSDSSSSCSSYVDIIGEGPCSEAKTESGDLQWFCVNCELFFCEIDEISQCGAVMTQTIDRKHKLRYIDDEWEIASHQFQDHERNPLQCFNSRYLPMKELLVAEIRTLSTELSDTTIDRVGSATTIHIQQKIDKLKEFVKIGDAMTLAVKSVKKIKELPETDYIRLARWMVKNGSDLITSGRCPLILDCLGQCEVVTHNPCSTICSADDDHLIIVTPGKVGLLHKASFYITISDSLFTEPGPLSAIYQNDRVYCLHRKGSSSNREIVILCIQRPHLKLTRDHCWSVTKGTNVNSFTMSHNKIFIGNLDSIDIYSLDGQQIATLNNEYFLSSTNLLLCGDHHLAFLSSTRQNVTLVSTNGVKVWTQPVGKPLAMCIDWCGNLWVWSGSTKSIIVISKKGKQLCYLSSIVLKELATNGGSHAYTMQILDGYLWVASHQIGLYRFLVRAKSQLK